jgi:hypothetical protein
MNALKGLGRFLLILVSVQLWLLGAMLGVFLAVIAGYYFLKLPVLLGVELITFIYSGPL